MKFEIMSGFVGQQQMMETSPSSSAAFGSSSALPLASSSNTDSSARSGTRGNHVRVRKESKYIKNSRDDKLFSRIWLPGQEYPTPKASRLKLYLLVQYKYLIKCSVPYLLSINYFHYNNFFLCRN